MNKIFINKESYFNALFCNRLICAAFFERKSVLKQLLGKFVSSNVGQPRDLSGSW